jgi:mRNA-degrading endonuclease RelE of RelBE toxin-antitoxin system
LRYQIEITPEAEDHLVALPTRDQRIITDAIMQQLAYTPTQPSPKRKRLRPNDLDMDWELRVGTFRVFYDVEDDIVYVQAIAVKKRNEYYIAGKKIKI